MGYWCPRGTRWETANLTNGVNCLRSTVSKSNGARKRPESASGIEGTTKPIGVVYVPVFLAACNGIISCNVVEQDVPPLLPVG